MKTKNIILLLLLLAAATLNTLQAQEDRNRGIIQSALYGLEYEVRAGFNIGGTSPLPLPKEIRALTGYSPNINIAIGGDITKWLGRQEEWGIVLGLRLETKGMEAEARTKNYSMEIIGDGGERMSGRWTGKVKTKFRASYFSIPLLAAWKANERLRVTAGPYVSFLKLRASVGTVGNDNCQGYRFLYLPAAWTITNGYYNHVGDYAGYNFGTNNTTFLNVAREYSSASPDVTWETAVKYNFGVDAKFWNNKISLTFDYFKEDPINRKYHHNKMTFPSMYQFTEKFMLVYSHDEVVHGKSPMVGGGLPCNDLHNRGNCL